ncbi:MAG: histidinol-phosphate aminotransferase family protein [Methylocystis sp.]|nr:histidinol-phosphate aminotransferase family protein [Methylocystis sp.]
MAHDSGLPPPRSPVAADSFRRPDWTAPRWRDPARLWLDKNENTDPHYLALVASLIHAVPDWAFSSYPDSAALYAKLAAHVGVEARNLLLAAGSDGVIRSVFEAYVNEGDTVLIPKPSFAMYSVYGKMYGACLVELDYQPSPDGPRLPAETIIAALRQRRPKVFCLPNPDSPTGAVLDLDEMKAIVAAAGEVDALLLVDEAYYPFHDQTVVPLISQAPHVVVCRSTGKAWGCAGLRIGYGVASPQVAFMLHKVRPMYEVNTFAVCAFERILDLETEMLASVRRLLRGKAEFLSNMDSLGLRTLSGGGNFMHVAFGPWDEPVHAALSEMAYYRKDFDAACLRGFSRFSAGTPQQLRPLIAKIRDIVTS